MENGYRCRAPYTRHSGNPKLKIGKDHVMSLILFCRSHERPKYRIELSPSKRLDSKAHDFTHDTT